MASVIVKDIIKTYPAEKKSVVKALNNISFEGG